MSSVFFSALLVLVLAAPLPLPSGAEGAWAVTQYSGTLTGVMEYYETVENKTAVPAYMYLNLTVDNPFEFGRSNYFYLYGRFAEDIGEDENTENRLYSAFWNVEGLAYNTDLRLGRQYQYNMAGFSLMDGAHARFNKVGGYADIALYGGGDVSFEEHYTRGDRAYGASIDLAGVRNLSAGVSFLKKEEDEEDARKTLGMNAGYRFKDYLRVNAEGRYDFILEATDYYDFSVKGYLPKSTIASLEYSYYLPTFDANDIWAIFAGDESKELTLKVEHTIKGFGSVYGSHSRIMYETDDDTKVYEIGTKILDVKGFLVDLALNSQSGEDELKGARLSGVYSGGNYTAGGGFEFNNYERYDMYDDEDSTLVFAEGKYFITESSSVSLYMEHIDSVASDGELYAVVRAQHAFGGPK